MTVRADEDEAADRGARRHAGEHGDEAAAALLRRVEEVAAVAHGERAGRSTPRDPESPSGVARIGVTLEAAPPLLADGVDPLDDLSAQEAIDHVDEEDVDESEESLTVAQFYDRLKRALVRAFPDEVWVTGEIRGFREARGHRYIELADEGVESAGRSTAQQLEVVCWARDWAPVGAALADAGVTLEVGRVVRVRGRVSVWEGGSKLRFTLTALDVEALLGGIAAARRRLLLALEREGLLEANDRLRVPLVPLRIGVVTSQGSEAHRDFVGQLTRSGFAFEVHLERSLVQGPEAPRQIAAALGRLAKFEPDLAVVVRGGGARGDLAAFDSEEVARAIALAPFPVWTGIGHTGDRSVADEVAQRALITPTACGEAVVSVVADYWEGSLRQVAMLSSLARARLDGAVQRLHGAASSVTRGARHQLVRRSDELTAARALAGRSVGSRLDREGADLRVSRERLAQAGRRATAAVEQSSHRHRQVLRAYDPGRQLERGWSLTRDASGRLVRSASQLAPGSEMTTRFVDGDVVSTVSRVATRTPEIETDVAVETEVAEIVNEDEV
ncbi:MAG: xseA [Acidimicrobiaceae bacterium]|nr:xseA [Acidimicrobiaceae bacterium]